MSETEAIFKAACKKYKWELLFCNEYKMGFQTSDGAMWTMTIDELANWIMEQEG